MRVCTRRQHGKSIIRRASILFWLTAAFCIGSPYCYPNSLCAIFILCSAEPIQNAHTANNAFFNADIRHELSLTHFHCAQAHLRQDAQQVLKAMRPVQISTYLDSTQGLLGCHCKAGKCSVHPTKACNKFIADLTRECLRGYFTFQLCAFFSSVETFMRCCNNANAGK